MSTQRLLLSRVFNHLIRMAQMVKNLSCNVGVPGSIPGLGRSPWRGEWLPTPVLLPEESHGQRNLTGYSLWDYKESDTTEQLTLSLVGEK